MNNFLDFIIRDIDFKKASITSLPSKTKNNKKKINATIAEYEEKYKFYKDTIKNYLIVKSHSFEVKENNLEYDKVKEEIIALEQVKFLLNPKNTYVEKLGFDELIYQINNYNKFNFSSLNDILNSFLDKFELVGITLTSHDFKLTPYVNEYMSAFLDVRFKKEAKYDKVSAIFEKVYWLCPDLINHLAINFKRLIRENAKKFDEYILKLQKKSMNEFKVKSYDECQEELKRKYSRLEELERESIGRIISLALEGSLDINQYMSNNKVRTSAFASLIPEDIDINDKDAMNKICETLYKLKFNIEEYQNYIKFLPLLNLFKNSYSSLITEKGDNKLKEIYNEIGKKEKEIDSCNKILFSKEDSFLNKLFKTRYEKTRIISNHYIKELCTLYDTLDDVSSKDKIKRLITLDSSLEDVLGLYYSFDYIKKRDIQVSYEVNDYNEIIDISSDFDLYSMHPNNLIVKSVNIFEDANISEIIANKYKLSNLKIEEADLSEENLGGLYNKIKLILRVNTIENSTSSVEKIWFMVKVKRIIDSEKVESVDEE